MSEATVECYVLSDGTVVTLRDLDQAGRRAYARVMIQRVRAFYYNPITNAWDAYLLRHVAASDDVRLMPSGAIGAVKCVAHTVYFPCDTYEQAQVLLRSPWKRCPHCASALLLKRSLL